MRRLLLQDRYNEKNIDFMPSHYCDGYTHELTIITF